jgi:hypothetical protein
VQIVELVGEYSDFHIVPLVICPANRTRARTRNSRVGSFERV